MVSDKVKRQVKILEFYLQSRIQQLGRIGKSQPAEAAACEPFLDRQIDLIQPRLIVALGKTAAVNLLKREAEYVAVEPHRCVEIASEYRYRDVVPDRHALVVTISQSGETADTLAALEFARSIGQGNTLAGLNKLAAKFGASPFGKPVPKRRRAAGGICARSTSAAPPASR